MRRITKANKSERLFSNACFLPFTEWLQLTLKAVKAHTHFTGKAQPGMRSRTFEFEWCRRFLGGWRFSHFCNFSYNLQGITPLRPSENEIRALVINFLFFRGRTKLFSPISGFFKIFHFFSFYRFSKFLVLVSVLCRDLIN